MLEINDLTVTLSNRELLHNISVKINTGARVLLSGHNGSGKSTLLKTAYGLIKTSSGDILLDGKKIVPTPQKLVECGIFMVPQGKRVFRNMTVMENLELATHFWKDRSIFPERLEEVLAHFLI